MKGEMIVVQYSLQWTSVSDMLRMHGVAEVIKEYAKIAGFVNEKAVSALEYYRNYALLLDEKGAKCCAIIGNDNHCYGFGVLYAEKFWHNDTIVGNVSDLYVMRCARKAGKGTALLNAIKEKAKELNCVQVLFTATANTRTEKLYNKIFKKRSTVYVWENNLWHQAQR